MIENLGRWTIKSFLPAVVVCAIFLACSKQDDAEKARLLIAKGAVLAEAHDIAGLLQLASEDIRASPMDLDRRGIKGVLWRTFNYYGPFEILYPRPGIEVKNEANEASVQFPFLIVKKEQIIPDLDKFRADPKAWIQALGQTADLYHLRLQLTKQDGDWLVAQANLERFTGVGFEE